MPAALEYVEGVVPAFGEPRPTLRSCGRSPPSSERLAALSLDLCESQSTIDEDVALPWVDESYRTSPGLGEMAVLNSLDCSPRSQIAKRTILPVRQPQRIVLTSLRKTTWSVRCLSSLRSFEVAERCSFRGQFRIAVCRGLLVAAEPSKKRQIGAVGR